MLTLCFDTSTAQGAVALVKSGQVLAERNWLREKSHTELLTPAIETCLDEASISLASVDALVVGCGPGSFTGIRVAVNAGKSLAFALRKPVYAIDTLTSLAHSVQRRDLPIVAMLNAYKNLLFVARFTVGSIQDPTQISTLKMDGPICAVSVPQLESMITVPHVCLGDGFGEYETLFSDRLRALLFRRDANEKTVSDFPSAVILAALAEQKRPLDWKVLQPLYIRASGAEENLGARQERDS